MIGVYATVGKVFLCSGCAIATVLADGVDQYRDARRAGAAPGRGVLYERSEERRGYANGYKPKTVKTRVGGG